MEDLRALQLAELDLLKELLRVCAEHNLKIWVEGGTMLGAVRHKGFIPWDDDIDMQMPRHDYDILLQHGHEWFRYPYFLQSAYSEPGYFRGHAQLRNDNTAAIRPSEGYRKFNQGIFIDIFVLDACPDDPEELNFLCHDVSHTLRCLKAVDLDILYSGRLLQVFRKIWMRRKVKKTGFINIYKSLENRLRATEMDAVKFWTHITFSGSKYPFDRHIFDHTEWMDFEDIKVPVPAGYHNYLLTVYGDNYMTPIKSPTAHGDLVVSTTRSWREVAPEVRRDWEKGQLKRLARKLAKKLKK